MARRRPSRLKSPELNRRVDELIEAALDEYGPRAGADYVREAVVTALRLLRDDASTGDLKIVSHALKELRHAFRTFAPYTGTRKVAVFGSARTGPEHADWKQAHRFSEQMVERGWMVITGAGDGIMGAAQGGAGRDHSFGVNIRLPFEQSANEVIAGDPKLVNFRYFFTRKVTFVKEAHAIALFPGGFGTHDEGFEALTLIQTGKSELLPVVYVDTPGGSYWKDWGEYVSSHLGERGLIDPDDQSLFRITDDLEVAVEEVCRFYRNYHSSRQVGENLVLRVQHEPDPALLEELNDEYGDLLVGGTIRSRGPFPEESDDVPQLPRIVLRFNRRSVGRLRQMVDRLNEAAPAAAPGTLASPHEIVEQALSEAAEDALEEEG